MSRFAVNNLPIEMFALWLLEFAICYYLAYALLSPGVVVASPPVSTTLQAFLLALAVESTAFLIGLYRPALFARTRSMLVNTALGGLLAFPAALIAGRFLGLRAGDLVGNDLLWPIKTVGLWIAALFVTRLVFLTAIRFNMFVRRVAMLGGPGEMAATVSAVRSGQRGFLEIVSGPQETIDPAALRKAGVLDVVVSNAASQRLTLDERGRFAAKGISIETEAAFWEHHLKRVDVATIGEDWAASLDAGRRNRLQLAINRGGDILISLGLLVFTLPLMGVVALLVRADSQGNILYRQERIGLDGRPFTLLKFRSMRANAESSGPAWASMGDPRVTRVGSFIRRTRMDELPQLFNILRGEMSFIGPRPERPHFVQQLAAVIPFYGERARVKPGLTGWAQVNFPYGASVEDARVKLSYDLYYVKYRSALLDMAIIFSTIRVILFQEGSR